LKIKKQFLIISFLFVLFNCTYAQVPDKYCFFKGDTLQGFDVVACFKEASLYAKQHGLNETEKLLYIKGMETFFMEQKYRIDHASLKKMSVPSVLTSPCNNTGFETGDFTAWTGGVGYNSRSDSALIITTPSIKTHGIDYPEPFCANHTIVNAAAGNDPYGAFPMLDPLGGNYALRLGGELININGPQVGDSCTSGALTGGRYHSGGEVIQRQILVTPATALFSYNYAVVLDRAPHAKGERPYFKVEVLDQPGDTIPCLQYFLQGDTSASPGMTTSSVSDVWGGQVYYMAWRSNSINLSSLIGTSVKIRITAAGCIFGSHFGYAYFDASCSPLQCVSSTAPCQGAPITFTAPAAGPSGMYSWTTVPPGGTGIVGSSTGQSVTLNSSGTYEVIVTTYPGCSYHIDTTISLSTSPPVLSLTNVQASCSSCGDGSSNATVSGGVAGYTYTWSPAPGGGQGTPNASGLSPGTYTCCITDGNGCSVCAQSTISFSSGFQNLSGNDDFYISPNPFNASLSIRTSDKYKNAEIILYTVQGQELMHQKINSPMTVINTTGLSRGIYFLRMQSNEEMLVRKIIRE
jgi:hypothetical protein